MSKSKGNVINPFDLLKNYHKDVLRTYFVSKINFLQDGILDEELLKNFYQDFFINNLGNLISRTNKMLHLYRKGIIPSFKEIDELEGKYKENELIVSEFEEAMDDYKLTHGFNIVQELINSTNKLISEFSPWEIFKKEKNEEVKKSLLDQIINLLFNRIKLIAYLINFFAPETSERIFESVGTKKDEINKNEVISKNFLDGRRITLLKNHLYESIKQF